jgi:hypothetical protein
MNGRYRSKSPAASARQQAVFRSMRSSGLPRVDERWTVYSRSGERLSTGADFRVLREVGGEGATVLPTGHPLTHPRTGEPRPRREETVEIERAARRAGAE